MKIKKETRDVAIKGIRNLFRLKQENKVIKYRILRDISNVFAHEEDYYKPERVNNLWSNNYIEYKSKGDTKTLSVKKYHLNEIRLYLKDNTNNLKNLTHRKFK